MIPRFGAQATGRMVLLSTEKRKMKEEQIFRGREDLEFSWGTPEFEIRLSGGVLNKQPDKK